jgi:hypothetical protein
VSQGPGGRHVRLGEEDSIAIQDVTKMANDNMVSFTEPIAWEVREILAAQNNPKKMFNLLKTRRASIQLASMDTLEAGLWSAPSDSEDAETTPKGIPFWVQKDDTASGNGEFTGGDPSGFTNGAGNLASSTYSGWQNWVGNYALINDDDLITKLQAAFLNMNYQAPGGHAKDVPANQKLGDVKLYTNQEVWLACKKVAKQQNDQVGFDLDPVGNPTFNRRQFEYVAYLDADANNPIYLIDLDVFGAHYLKGDYWRETGPGPVAGRHNTIGMFLDLSYQWVCTNRRRCGVIHKDS